MENHAIWRNILFIALYSSTFSLYIFRYLPIYARNIDWSSYYYIMGMCRRTGFPFNELYVVKLKTFWNCVEMCKTIANGNENNEKLAISESWFRKIVFVFSSLCTFFLNLFLFSVFLRTQNLLCKPLELLTQFYWKCS